jgi:hypothetical protein
MARPGSHKYDITRARLRNILDDYGVPDKKADELANEIMQSRRGKLLIPARAMRRARRFVSSRRHGRA